jgi:hypothetical protein
MNTTSGIITLKISEWSKITKITTIHFGCVVHKTLIINGKILLKCGKFILVECVVSLRMY